MSTLHTVLDLRSLMGDANPFNTTASRWLLTLTGLDQMSGKIRGSWYRMVQKLASTRVSAHRNMRRSGFVVAMIYTEETLLYVILEKPDSAE